MRPTRASIRLAESPKDKHIFITPSYQRRLIEFDPVTKAFRLHEMDGGFYPHTVRFDAKDRVWFTLALSNQVGMFDRTTREVHASTTCRFAPSWKG